MIYNEKQVQILETAEKLFAEKGYEGASVRDIAERAGINLAMISYYFGSKEKLMEALFDHRTRDVKERIAVLVKDQGLTPIEKVYKLVDEFIERVIIKQQFYKIMMSEQMINKNPVVLQLIKDIKFVNAQHIGKIVKEGQKLGMFKKKVDVIMMQSTIFGVTTQIIVNQSYYREFNNMEDLSDQEFHKILKKRLGTYLKELYKAILGYEE